MIKLENVNKYFNYHKKNEIHVIDNTSLEFGEKSLVALLGESGSGKTTLLNTIGGLDNVTSGNIYINGEKITRFSTGKIDEIRNLNIGYIFQNYYLVEDMTVYDNVSLVLKMLGIKDKEEIKKRVDYCLDKVGMYRYRNRLASMLSGGERQRVGIARAIVKNPNIIIADEPTGNLDSKNTLEIMNIIKSISKEKLVILVTHEKELANFYADRIINISDGKVISDKINKNNLDLDYQMDNKIYLKDIEKKTNFNKNNLNINCYGDNKIDLDIVVKDNNIYIKSNNLKQIKVVDNNSSIEFVNDHYKKITKDTVNKYKFDFDKIINNNIKYKYSSIFNLFTLIKNGIKKLMNYTVLKKILLIGFFISAMFILYSTSNIFGVLNIKDSKFVTKNKEYIDAKTGKLDVDKVLEIEKNEDISYVLPGSSKVTLIYQYNDYYQSTMVGDKFTGSLSSINLINENDLIYGEMPKELNDIVVDKIVIENMFKTNHGKNVGIYKVEDMVGKYVNMKYEGIDTAYKYPKYRIVGIVSKDSPSIYTDNSLFINIIANAKYDGYDDYTKYDVINEYSTMEASTGIENIYGENYMFDYELLKDQIQIKEGRAPINDYEAIVSDSYKEEYKLNKEAEIKVNGKKLKVVGYYFDKYQTNYVFVNNNTIKYGLIANNSSLSIIAKNNDKDKVIAYLKNKGMYAYDSYADSRYKYIKEIKKTIFSRILSASIMLIISLVEIFLIIRSSFLSRIKEVGIYRAIGVKRKDIYKMFLGEILSITTIASMPGYLIMALILKKMSSLPFVGSNYVFNANVLILSVVLIYLFNIIVGLLPVYNVIRKTPAQILARNDIE